MRLPSVARSLAALIAVPVLASACSFLIPENPSEPRYNAVLGERHVPQENMKSVGMGPQSMAAPVAPVQQQPVAEPAPMPVVAAPAPAPVAAMDLPPVDATTERIAAERMQAEQDRALAARMAPSENTAARSGSYPELNQVPPAPPRSGPDSDAERLAAVRAELERERQAASATSAQVRSAAAAEPSMLPGASVPAGSIATLPPPPPVLPAANTAPAPIQMDALPMATAPMASAPAMEPITLRAPVAVAPAPQFVPTPATRVSPTVTTMPAAAGSFDPMAGARYGSSTSGTGYLPSSRYSGYRR